jgi:exodeoxyribonuclease VII small subunit
MAKSAKAGKDVSYGEAAARLEEILGKIEEGQVDIDELSGLVKEAARRPARRRKRAERSRLSR